MERRRIQIAVLVRQTGVSFRCVFLIWRHRAPQMLLYSENSKQQRLNDRIQVPKLNDTQKEHEVTREVTSFFSLLQSSAYFWDAGFAFRQVYVYSRVSLYNRCVVQQR